MCVFEASNGAWPDPAHLDHGVQPVGPGPHSHPILILTSVLGSQVS